MQQYLDLLRKVRTEGVSRGDRTGTGTQSIFGHQMRFDLADGFPLVTTKKMVLRLVVHELLWILSGSTNVKDLHRHNVHIWDEWADEDGMLSKVYGAQWRAWEAPDGRRIDQVSQVVDSIRNNPDSRRHIISGWNVADIDEMALPPCHLLYQFYVANGKLSCQMYQRSADLALGVPFNSASTALLTMMMAQVCDLEPGEVVHTFGDAHIYNNHFDRIDEQLTRPPYELPTLQVNPEVRDLLAFTIDDFELLNYRCHGRLKFPIAV